MPSDDEVDSSSALSESDVLVVTDMGQSGHSFNDRSSFSIFEKLVDDGLKRSGVVEELSSVSRRRDSGDG